MRGEPASVRFTPGFSNLADRRCERQPLVLEMTLSVSGCLSVGIWEAFPLSHTGYLATPLTTCSYICIVLHDRQIHQYHI